jgi:hypothetical protein
MSEERKKFPGLRDISVLRSTPLLGLRELDLPMPERKAVSGLCRSPFAGVILALFAARRGRITEIFHRLSVLTYLTDIASRPIEAGFLRCISSVEA